MNKKGSLNLSIEAIVIVVIAFTVLGLGLGFVKERFDEFGGLSTTISESLKNQIMDDLRTGNKKLSFPSTNLGSETSQSITQAVGIKNTEDESVNLKVYFSIKADDGFKVFSSEKNLQFKKGGIDISAKIDWDDSEQVLKPGETRLIPITITAPDKTGNYLFKVTLKDKDEKEFDSKTFFIKTS